MTSSPVLLLCWARGAAGSDTYAIAETRASVARAGHGLADIVVVRNASSAAAALADHDARWVGFVDAGDELVPGALERLWSVVDGDPTVDVVYSDEATRAPDGTLDPFYKPGWSPDRLRCQPYVGRLTLMRRALLDDVGGVRAVGSRAVTELDVLLRVTERARRVEHVPTVLCVRATGGPIPALAPGDVAPACGVVDEHLERVGIGAESQPHATVLGLLRLEPRLAEHPLVSIVVPTGGTRRRVRGVKTSLVANCVRSVLERSTYPHIEVVCVADPSLDVWQRRELAALGHRVRIVPFDEPFHFAHKVNVGALAASGDVLVLLNDDTEVHAPGWLEAMLLYALDPGVGAVGARLLFEDDRIQHCGVVGVKGNPGHPYYGLPGDTPGHGGNALVPGNFLAVTAACLMTRRECFETVGGLSTWFPVNYNDIDYCLKLQRAGLRVVATPDATLYHYESSSRSGDVATDELVLVGRRWGRCLRDDPFYGPNFPSGNADFVPAPLIA